MIAGTGCFEGHEVLRGFVACELVPGRVAWEEVGEHSP